MDSRCWYFALASQQQFYYHESDGVVSVYCFAYYVFVSAWSFLPWFYAICLAKSNRLAPITKRVHLTNCEKITLKCLFSAEQRLLLLVEKKKKNNVKKQWAGVLKIYRFSGFSQQPFFFIFCRKQNAKWPFKKKKQTEKNEWPVTEYFRSSY